MFAADAVARLSGTVGVAAVTAGPGKIYCRISLSVCLSVCHSVSLSSVDSLSCCPFPVISVL